MVVYEIFEHGVCMALHPKTRVLLQLECVKEKVSAQQ